MAFSAPITAVTGATFTAAQFNTSVRDNVNALWVGTTAGDIDYYSSAVAKTRVGVGTAYQLLKSTGTAPAWEALANMTANTGVVASQAAGDVFYATSATALARLAKPAGLGLLQNSTAGTPSFLTGGDAYQVLRKNSANTGYEFAVAAGLHKIGTVDFAPGGQSFAGTWADITSASLNLVTSVTCTIVVMAGVTGYNGTTGRSFYVRAMVAGVGDAAGDRIFNGGALRNEAIPYIYMTTGVAAGTITCKMQCQADSDPNVVERGRMIAMAFAE
jgi:hypothetical protein